MATITLSERDIEIVRDQLKSGRFDDMQDVVHAALELLDEQERYARLEAELQIAFEQDERGEGIPYSAEWFEEVKQKARQDFLEGKPVKDFVKP